LVFLFTSFKKAALLQVKRNKYTGSRKTEMSKQMSILTNALLFADVLLELLYVALSPGQLFSTSMLHADKQTNKQTKEERKELLKLALKCTQRKFQIVCKLKESNPIALEVFQHSFSLCFHQGFH